ncbi:MAG TPA: lysylphosphatidylglycerol synthase domain-containing protein [Candidatus Saccharimonadales bacterium]|jgi:uncharacterized membrane protein YbhN (UPF0104 family)|nr:lysylphosphatidylglycerol synthase domain-containing protein [Candidatus Saccharimonadales bacterium]
MSNLKKILASLIIVATAVAFGYYIWAHPELLAQLAHVNPLVLGSLVLLYGSTLIVLSLILMFTLQLCSAKLAFRENLLLTCYTAIVNFFGPLQSGPGFRGIYLKRKHKVSLKKYTMASLIYYGFFALFSGVMLCAATKFWWISLLLLAVALIVVAALARLYTHRFGLNAKAIILLALATLAQVLVMVAIYFVELHSVNSHITLAQAVSYTGTANLSLFVSVTPGAIGIREAFLLFTTSLHHIPNATIIAVSVLDRAVYVVFLICIFGLSLTLHFKDKLGVKATDQESA